MTIGHHYVCTKWPTSAHAMTPLHGDATCGLRSLTHPHIPVPLTLFLLLGVAVALAAPPQEIYDGVWSYNAMLTCTSLGGFFYVISVRSHVIALFSGTLHFRVIT